MFAVQGLFAIIEFEHEESAQNVVSYDEDILLKGRRLVVKPRTVKQEPAAPSDDPDSGSTEPSAADLRSQLINKLASCGSVRNTHFTASLIV